MARFKVLFFPIVAGVLLLFVQFRLVLRHMDSSKSEFVNRVSIQINKIGNHLENNYYCYRSEAEHVVPKNHQFYFLYPTLQSGSNGGFELDTFASKSSIEDYAFSTYNFGTKTKINLRFDFEFLPLSVLPEYDSMDESEAYVKTIYKDYIIAANHERLIDTLLLDSLLRQEIESIPGVGQYAYQVTTKDSVVIQHGHLGDNQIRIGKDIPLYQSRLMPDIRLELGFYNSLWNLTESNIYFYLATFGLSLLILFLFFRNHQYLKKSKKANELKSEFINLMTHEFNTPVTNLSLAAENFNSNQSKEKIEQLMTIVSLETNRIKKNIQTLFEINKLTANEISLDLAAHDLHVLLEQTIRVFEVTFAERNVNVVWSLKAEHDTVVCDKVHLLNVLTNLIENSLKYSDQQPQIEIYTTHSDGYIELIIKDHGIGMTKEQIAQAFDKYYRSDDLFVQSNKGMGLGLFYARKIVNLHKGSIEIKSEVGHWTEILIKLPVHD